MNKRKLIRRKCKIIFSLDFTENVKLIGYIFSNFSEYIRKNSANRNDSNYHFELTKLKREVERIETHKNCLIDDLISKKK